MKTTAEGTPLPGEVNTAFARARGRQLWLLAAIIALGAVGFAGIKLNRPKPIEAPKISFAPASSQSDGMVAQILVKPGEQVRKGELLAVLEFSRLDAQHEAALDNVIQVASVDTNAGPAVTAPLPPSGLNGGLTKRAVRIVQPSQALPAIPPKINLPQTEQSAGPIPAKGQDLPRQVALLQSGMDALTKQTATLRQNIKDDQDAVTTSQALVATLTAVATRTKADADKSATLLAEGVISAHEASKAQGYSLQAQGRLQEAKVSAAQAVETLGDAQRTLDSTNQTIAADQDKLKKLNSQVAQEKVHPQPAPVLKSVPLAPAQVPSQSKITYKLQSIKGPIMPNIPPAPLPVTFMGPAQQGQLIQKAEHILNQVDQNFESVCIYAPTDGTVTQINARPGESIAKGTVLFEIRHNG